MSKIYKSRKHGKNDTGYTQYPDKLEELRIIFTKIKTKDGKNLSNTTINNYVNKINKLATMITGEGYNGDHKFLLKPDLIIKKLDESGMKSLKDYLSPIVKLLEYYDSDENKKKPLIEHMTTLKKKEDNIRDDNLATEKEQQNAISINEINNKLENFNIQTKLDLFNKLIVSLYFDNEIIARNNYWNMKIASVNKKNKDFNKHYNYLILDRDKEPIQFVLLNYKTANTYGLQKYSIKNKRLKFLLKKYLEEFKKEPGNLLFDKNGVEYRPSTFSDIIKKAMQDVLGKPLNIDLIRKIHITEFMKSGLKSENEKKEFARRCLHNIDKQKEYMKVNLFEEDRNNTDEDNE
jgi:hypothetical protein